MQNWFDLFPKSTGLSLYAWIIFCLLPFYFIIRSATYFEIILGVFMILLFFTTYRLAFIKKGWTVYLSVSIEMLISIGMTLYFGYVYFSLFLAFFIGNIQHKAGFITLYVLHLITTLAAVIIGFYVQSELFMMQLPFIAISIIGVILLPFNIYNRNKREKLESELQEANQRISQLVVLEERQRIARDLHDTLGQKLSLIGLKSELAGKLIDTKPERTQAELTDIHQTARTALKEVRELVSDMKGARLSDELLRVEEILQAADITLHVQGSASFNEAPPLIENVLSMCLKEAVTNVVKHSEAENCYIAIEQSTTSLSLTVEDDGKGMSSDQKSWSESGLQGIKERLGFINGQLNYYSSGGTKLAIQVPLVIQQIK